MNDEYLPIPDKPIWLLFDLSNGDNQTKRYVWWFDTRDKALNHRKWQRKQKYSACLSMPIRYIPVTSKKKP